MHVLKSHACCAFSAAPKSLLCFLVIFTLPWPGSSKIVTCPVKCKMQTH